MYLKFIILLLISIIFNTTNGSILLWSKIKFKINPLQKFENDDFKKFVENLDSPKTIIYKTNSEMLSSDYQKILKGYYTGYNLNGEINIENATDISGNGDELDLEKIKKHSNDDHVLYAIVIPNRKHLNKREINNKSLSNDTSETVVAAATTNEQLIENSKSSAEPMNGPVLYKAVAKTDNYYGLLYSTKPLLLKLDNITLTLGNTSKDMVTVDQTPRVSTSNRLNIQFVYADNSKIYVRFIFYWLHGYWYLNTVKITDKTNTNYDFYLKENITAPAKFSYHCSDRTIFQDSNNTDNELYLYDMQIQIDAQNGRFNDAYDCVNFMTAPIWSSLFVTALLGLGLIISLIAITDIKTMDKFDNHKTKQLSITVTE